MRVESLDVSGADILRALGVPTHPTSFEIGELLGSGGFADVWSVRWGRRRCALKVGHRHDAIARERFAYEADALVEVGPPFVPAVHASGHLADGRPFILMDCVSGSTLASQLSERTQGFDAHEASDVLARIVTAVAAVHDAGLVHRDLKPSNIIVESSGAVCLIDFGLVRSDARAAITRAGVALGTTEYMAPEQLRGAAVGPRADVYSIGVIAHELLTLTPPFTGPRATVEYGHLALRPARLAGRTDISDPFDELIARCLAKDPGRRPADGAALSAALQSCSSISARRTVATPCRSREQPARKPVALVCLSGPGALPYGQQARELGGTVAAHNSERCVIAFPDHSSDAVTIAIEFARGWTAMDPERGAAVHLTHAIVREGRRGTSVFGPEVSKPELWIPDTAWSGTVVTSQLLRVLPSSDTRPAVGLPGFVRLVSGDDPVAVSTTPLCGRESELALLRSLSSAAIDGDDSTLVLLEGASGVGKTRLADALVTELEAGGRARAVVVRGASSFGGAMEQTTRQLCRALDADRSRLADGRGAAIDHIASALVAAARERPLVVIVDDGEKADDLALDALEHAVAVGQCPLTVVVFSSRALVDARPRWGTRAARFERIGLGPLDRESGRRLAAALVEPVQHPNVRVLDRLIDLAEGNPGALVEVVRAIAREGLIRRYPNGGRWYIAGDELDALEVSAADEWLAAHALAGCSAELAELAQLCAVAGDGARVEELEAMQSVIERDDGAQQLFVDVSFGLQRLLERGLLVEHDGHHSIAPPPRREGIRALIGQERRRRLHDAAYAVWSKRRDESSFALDRLARHAEGSGRPAEAATTFVELGRRAATDHADLEAQALFSRAIANAARAGRRDLELAAVLGRGHVRKQLERYEDARGDLARARELAIRIGDQSSEVEATVAEAAVCDFMGEYATSAALVEGVHGLLDVIDDRACAQLLNWLGVVRTREARVDEANRYLRRAVELGRAVDDHTTVVGSLNMLGANLAEIGESEAGARALGESIERCQRVGDHFHLACALVNRATIWASSSATERALADLERALALARDFGFGMIELAAHINLAETYAWAGRVAAAADAARRSYEIASERFGEGAGPAATALYMAQYSALDGDLDAAREALSHCQEPEEPARAVILRSVELALDADATTEQWDVVCADAERHGPAKELAVMWWLRGRAALRQRDVREATTSLQRALSLADSLDMGIKAAVAADLGVTNA